MDPSHERHVERIVNDERLGSNLVRVTHQLLPGQPMPAPQAVQLAGVDDGLAGPDDNDFVGSETGRTGLHALDQV